MKINLKKGFQRESRFSAVLHVSLFTTVSLVLFFLVYCRPYRIYLPPLPSEIERIEGYVSIKITEDQRSARSKFSFLFQFPHQGRIEVSNIFSKTLYQIIVDEDRAVFTLPSKKVYWQGEEEEIIDKVLGFRLNLYEMISLLCGKWGDKELDIEGEKSMERWSLEKDGKGRVTSGRRGELKFNVKEFLANTPFPRILTFEHPLSRGRLKILSINFNQPVKEGIFCLSFLENYERKSWAEIEKMLDDEN